MKKRTEAVDIIIPVYNGYDDLQLCMPSVLKHTDLTRTSIREWHSQRIEMSFF